MAEIVILGAGLTGLSTAYHLEKNGFFDYALFEHCARPGGLAKSESFNGFIFDYTGHFLHLNNEYIKQLIDDLFGLNNCALHQRRAAIFSHDRYVPYPFQAHLNSLPTDVIIECIEGFIARKKYSSPTTFHGWVMKYFGKGLAEHFFFPYNEKLFDYSAEKLHHSWTGRFVPQVTLSSLLQGALASQHQRMGYNCSFYYPQLGGIELLAQSMARALTNQIKTNHSVVSIDTSKKEVIFSNGKRERYRRLVSTIPLDSLIDMMGSASQATFHNAQKKLCCTSVLSINLGLTTNTPNHHWVYYPGKHLPFYRVGFWHNVSQALAPKNHRALFAEVAYQHHATPSIEALTDATIAALAKLFTFSSNDIVLHKNLILNHAYVIYDAWRERNIARLLAQLSQMSVYSVGRYGAWKYASMEEALIDGKDVSERILGAINYPLCSDACGRYVEQTRRESLGK